MSIRNSSGPRQYYELKGIFWFKLSGLLMALLCIVGIIAGDYSFFSTKINLGCDILLEIFINIEVRVCSSSLLHAIIIWNHHSFFKKFSNILSFFNISLPLFWKISLMRLLYRMRSGSIFIILLKVNQQCPTVGDIFFVLLSKLGQEQY